VRYYDIKITNADGTLFAEFTSFVNGKVDLGALQVELDLYTTSLANPGQASSIKIWGVSLQTIAQQMDFKNKNIQVFGGMSPGLPLANPLQIGLLFQGLINQSIGNWVGTTQWIEFISVSIGTTEVEQPLNIQLDWKKGQNFGDAISVALKTACPTYSSSISVNPNLVLPQDDPGSYTTLVAFAQHVKETSAAILNPSGSATGYQGINIDLVGLKFVVSDGSVATTPKAIDFKDLVGQPTWVDAYGVQVTVVMRGDIDAFDTIILPSTIISTAASSTQYRDQSIFKGSFAIKSLHHVGNLRQPDAMSWITILDAYPAGQAAAETAVPAGGS
jgi:hypothetical protein